jgi:hypothetical protein
VTYNQHLNKSRKKKATEEEQQHDDADKENECSSDDDLPSLALALPGQGAATEAPFSTHSHPIPSFTHAQSDEKTNRIQNMEMHLQHVQQSSRWSRQLGAQTLMDPETGMT